MEPCRPALPDWDYVPDRDYIVGRLRLSHGPIVEPFNRNTGRTRTANPV